MKTVLKALSRIISHTAIAFTLSVIFFWVFMSENSNQNALEYEVITMLLKFASVYGFTSLIGMIPKIPQILKTFLHFVINAVSFVIFFEIFTRISHKATAFVVMTLFVIAYAVVTAILLVLNKIADRKKYHAIMKHTLEKCENLRLVQAEIVDISAPDGVVKSVTTSLGQVWECSCAIICTGTYLESDIFVGDSVIHSGPDGFLPAFVANFDTPRTE